MVRTIHYKYTEILHLKRGRGGINKKAPHWRSRDATQCGVAQQMLA